MSSKSAPRPPCWPGTTRTVPAGGRGEGRRRQRGGTAQSGAVPATHAKDPQRARAALSLYHCEPV
ncbi:hypothetical protein AZ25_2987 [Bordetella holmesii 04P3421]|nr:hypothetical protein L573_2832 [Bordetella holmesii H620]KAK77922.1 hypothetical protein L503_3435 [Bordetella holmesii CDC-H809-BH]KCV05754.1 hypothetical protein L501_3548 [Bordetella holmesii CDC-H719-BH]KCV14294.1 hypothetical protein AZ25_2987 [Bordetella holmesii 04P3421]